MNFHCCRVHIVTNVLTYIDERLLSKLVMIADPSSCYHRYSLSVCAKITVGTGIWLRTFGQPKSYTVYSVPMKFALYPRLSTVGVRFKYCSAAIVPIFSCISCRVKNQEYKKHHKNTKSRNL